MAYLTLLYLQTNAECRRCVNYPSDKTLEMASSQMDVLRHNHMQMEKQHGVAMYKKESCIDVREDIAMVKKYLQEKLGRTRVLLCLFVVFVRSTLCTGSGQESAREA